MNRPKYIFIFLFVLLFKFPLSAQEVVTRTYTSLDGLSANAINSFCEDHFGYLWIGTILGLNRYDGTGFKKYDFQNGLPSLICTAIFEDHKGRIWVGTRKGIAEFRKDSFYVYENVDHLQDAYVFSIYEDPEGDVIANLGDGQYVFRGTQWEPYCNNLPLKNYELVVSALKTKTGEYFNTHFEIFYKNNQGEVTSVWRQPGDIPVFITMQGIDGEVYVNTSSALYQIDSAKKEQIFEEELRGKTIWQFGKISRNRWWVTTEEDGTLILEDDNNEIRKRTFQTEFNHNLKIFEDREKQVWATSPIGLMKVLPTPYSAFTIHEVNQKDHILNLIPYGENQFLVSVNNGTLLHIKYDLDHEAGYQLVHKYSFDDSIDFVDHYSTDLEGSLWMTTRYLKLYRLHNGKLENKTQLILDQGEQRAIDVSCDPASGKILFAMDSLLAIGNEYSSDTLFDDYKNFIQFPRQVICFGNGQIAIRNADGDVFVYTRNELKKHRFSKINLEPTGRRTIYSDFDKRLWIFMQGKELDRYNSGSEKEHIQKIIEESRDNINTSFFDFTIASDQSIWCITSRGIQQIYQDNECKYQSREYVIKEISRAAYVDWFKIIESGSKIWVNLQNQLIYFDKKLPDYPQKSRKVILEDVQLNNHITDWRQTGSAVTSYFEIPVNPHLKYYQNTLTFFYNTPTTLEDQGTTYSYRLLPDTTWSEPTRNKSVSFIKLQSSPYTFQVRSRNTGMDWGDVALFHFMIQKPIWETFLFKMFVITVATVIVTWQVRSRIRQERKKGEIKNQLLELEMRALRSQMNPHFIYNALNSIQSLVATQQTKQAGKYINIFSRLLRQVLENSKHTAIPLSKELESLHHYFDLEKLRFDTEVNYEEVIDQDLFPESIQIPPLILQPFVENALWHGLSTKEGEKKIMVKITTEDEWIRFSISDNGIGRKKSAELKSRQPGHESVGIGLTAKRIQDFNRTMKEESIQIIDLVDEKNRSTGTQVLFRISKNPVKPSPSDHRTSTTHFI